MHYPPGTKVYARLDPNTYPTKIQVTDAEIHAVQITRGRVPPRMELHHHPISNKEVSPYADASSARRLLT
jgi:hypothetical protein